MKKVVFTVCFLATICLPAQILPVEDLNEVTGTSVEEQIQGIRHIKDVNGVLDKYVGTWKGTFDGKQIELVITKLTRDYTEYVQSYHEGTLLWDELMVKHKITQSNGDVIQNTLDVPEDNPETMMKYKFYDVNTYTFEYYGVNYRCGDNGILFMRYRNETTITLRYLLRGSTDSSCTGQVERTIPISTTIVLSKQ